MRRALILGAMVVVFGLLALAVVPRLTGDDDGELSILVLGDSYSAGNGAGDYTGPEECRQSPHNYGSVFARLAEEDGQPTSVTTVACSGAVAADLELQVQSIEPTHDLLLLTIGGNDARFAEIVGSCLVAVAREGARCDAALTAAEQLVGDGTLEARVVAALEAVRERAHPDARIVLLGYPYLEGDPDFQVPVQESRPAFTLAGARLHALGKAADELQARAAESVDGVTFVSTREAFAGHELLAETENPERWMVQPLVDATLGEIDLWYHPDREGHRATAELLFTDDRVPKDDLVG